MAAASKTISSNAAAKVFGTFELLENILIHLFDDGGFKCFILALRKESLKAIYRLQRVNSTFRDTTARSKTLRVRTFKEIDSGGGNRDSAENAKDIWERRKNLIMASNPLLDFLSEVSPVRLRSHNHEVRPGVVFLSCDGDEEWLVQSQPYPVPSWRDMLLANQPLNHTAKIHVRIGGEECSAHVVELKEDTTVGELVVQVKEAAERDRSRFGGRAGE